MVRLTLLFALLWAGPAAAQAYYIVAGEHRTRADAVTMLTSMGKASGTPRITRQLIQGVGWRFVVRIDGFDSVAAAQTAAEGLSVDRPMQVYLGEGNQRKAVAVVVSSSPPVAQDPPPVAQDPSPPSPAPLTHDLPGADALIVQAVYAHGGRKGGSNQVARARAIRLEYRLEAPQKAKKKGEAAPLFSHQLLQVGTSARFSTTVVRGDFAPSVIVIHKGKEAWMAAPGEVRTFPTADAKRKISGFSPTSGALGMALGLPQALESEPAWKDLRTRALVQHNGRAHYRLTPSGDGRGHPMVSALIDAQTFQVSRMVLAGRDQSMTLDFANYRTVGEGVVAPFRIRTESGGRLTQDIYLQTLDLDSSIDPAMFGKPDALPRKRR